MRNSDTIDNDEIRGLREENRLLYAALKPILAVFIGGSMDYEWNGTPAWLLREPIIEAQRIYREGRDKVAVRNSDTINSPDYYRLPCGRDLEDFIAWKKLDFARGSALKYRWRAGNRDGESRGRDMAKCNHYCDAIARREGVPLVSVHDAIAELLNGADEWDGVERGAECE